jgi:hypothetical protein
LRLVAIGPCPCLNLLWNCSSPTSTGAQIWSLCGLVASISTLEAGLVACTRLNQARQMQYTCDWFHGLGISQACSVQKPPPGLARPVRKKIRNLMAACMGEHTGERFLKDWLHLPCIYLYMHQTKRELCWARLFPCNVFMLYYNGNEVASCDKKGCFRASNQT